MRKSFQLTQDQIVDLSHFLHQQVGDTLRTGPFNKVLNILVGDPREGKAFFYGLERCSQCHSTTGDLAHIASKYDPPVLQLKVVFPQTAAFGRRSYYEFPQTNYCYGYHRHGEAATGMLEEIDDFNVSLRDDAGQLPQLPTRAWSQGREA